MSAPADTGGSLGSEWPGDAIVALQTDADEARMGSKRFSVKSTTESIVSWILLICINNGAPFF